MPYDEQKKQSLETDRLQDRREKILEERQKKERKNAQKTLKKYSTGKFRGKNGEKGKAQQVIRSAKNLAKSATPWGVASLVSHIQISDFTYFFALMAAVLKDILDFSQFTGAGYALVVVLTFLISIFIGFMMILASFSDKDQGSQRINRKIIRSWLVLIAGTIIEILPGLSLVPIEAFSVIIIFALALSARKEAKKQRHQSNAI